MQQFCFLEIIRSLPFCNNATMQQFYILKIIQSLPFATMTILHLKKNSKFTICNNATINATILHLRDNSKFKVLQQCNNAKFLHLKKNFPSYPFCNNATILLLKNNS